MRITKRVERWFPAPNDPDKSEHLIRHLLPGEILDTINDSTSQETKYIIDEKSGDLVPEMASHTTPGAVQEKQFMKALRGWKNVFDEDGKPLEFNDENKVRAYREMDGYSQFVTDCRNTLTEDVIKEQEARTKNL